MRAFVFAGLVVLAAACARPSVAPALPEGVEAISLLGDTLRAPELPAVTRAAYEARLDSARRAAEANPDDPDALIWLGRRTAYLGRYREAIAIFTRGTERWPTDARFLRHRGHRWITVREFDRAVDDLTHAARLVEGRSDEIEPDGLPNARNVPTSTLQTNIYYHLGLAHYLRGEPAAARRAFDACLARSRNPDMAIATLYWLYLTAVRAGDENGAAAAAAPVARELEIIENRSYHRLMLVFTGVLPVDSVEGAEGLDGATVHFGLGAWMLERSRDDTGGWRFAMRHLLAARANPQQWPAFGYIAAEAALARSR
jgi:tetratricopeptide (TPR) repeat protein